MTTSVSTTNARRTRMANLSTSCMEVCSDTVAKTLEPWHIAWVGVSYALNEQVGQLCSSKISPLMPLQNILMQSQSMQKHIHFPFNNLCYVPSVCVEIDLQGPYGPYRKLKYVGLSCVGFHAHSNGLIIIAKSFLCLHALHSSTLHIADTSKYSNLDGEITEVVCRSYKWGPTLKKGKITFHSFINNEMPSLWF